MRISRKHSINELIESIGDFLRRDIEVVTLRRQDAYFLRNYFNTESVVSLHDVLDEEGVKYVDTSERVRTVMELKRKGLLPPRYEIEKILLKRDHIDVYRSAISRKGLFDVPLSLPRKVMSKRFRKGCVVVLPYFLEWDVEALRGLADEVLLLAPVEHGVAEVNLHSSANTVHQARMVMELVPDVVVAPSVTPSLLAVYEMIPTADVPNDNFLFYESGWRRLEDTVLRDVLFLLRRQPICDWRPTGRTPLLCSAFNIPLFFWKKVVLLSGVQNEADDASYSTALHFVWALTSECLHIFTYKEAEGKPTHPLHKVVMLRLSGRRQKDIVGDFVPSPKRTPTLSVVESPLYTAPFSPSSLEEYSVCPRKFLFGYILGIPDEEHPSTVLGEILHRLLELYHRGELQKPFTREIERLIRNYRGLTEGELSLIRRDSQRLFEAYLDTGIGEIGETVNTEVPFRFLLGGVEIRGRIDRIVRKDGGYVAIDYKTRGRDKRKAHINRLKNFESNKKELDFQVPLYIKALQERGLTPIKGFIYIYLDFDSTLQPYRIDLPYSEIKPYIEVALDKVVRLADAIRRDVEFLPSEKPPCREFRRSPCPYLGVCTVKRV